MARRISSRTSFDSVSGGTLEGPVSGGYIVIPWHSDALANGETQIFRYVVPFATARVEESSVFSTTTTSDPTYALSNGAAGGTDLIAARNMPASATVETITPTSSTALANRNLVKGDVLTLTLVADAGDALVDFDATITLIATGHVVADPAND